MSIVENKKAFHDYFVEERYEAGLVLEGWEVKAIRAGRVQLKEAYVILKGTEPFVIGMHVSALPTASTHVNPDPTRSRKLLLNAEEIRKLVGKVEQGKQRLQPVESRGFAREHTEEQVQLGVSLDPDDVRGVDHGEDPVVARPRRRSARWSWARCSDQSPRMEMGMNVPM